MKKISYEDAKGMFKNEICKLSNWLPSEEQTKKLRNIFNRINPTWIITTNYDLVLETILVGLLGVLIKYGKKHQLLELSMLTINI